jgi:hypothetical protein
MHNSHLVACRGEGVTVAFKRGQMKTIACYPDFALESRDGDGKGFALAFDHAGNEFPATGNQTGSRV